MALLVRPTLHADLSVGDHPIHGSVQHVLGPFVILGGVGRLNIDLLSSESAASEVAPVGTCGGLVHCAACQVVRVVAGVAFALPSAEHALSIATIGQFLVVEHSSFRTEDSVGGGVDVLALLAGAAFLALSRFTSLATAC